MNPWIEFLLSALLLASSFFTLVGSIGLVRFDQFFKRLHAPTKATTMGVGSALVVSICYHALIGNGLHPHELLITAFLIITAWPSLQQIPMKANITWTGVGAIASDSSSGPVEGGGFQASHSSVRNARVAYTITFDGKRFSGTATGTMARGFLVTVVPPRHHGGKL